MLSPARFADGFRRFIPPCLDDTWEIDKRGPMRLIIADILLTRYRLFGMTKYPWESPQADLAAARELIEKCGYGRPKEELEDAERELKAAK